MDGGDDFQLHWEDEVVVKTSEAELMAESQQIAAENLMFLSQDFPNYNESAELAVDPNLECVTEEVITDDWVNSAGQERVEVPLEQLMNPTLDVKQEVDDVPLPTDQDEYTAMRPWPCDFCSRRFRKKVALMNHMVAHQSDRPHVCNLCGVRYVRKCDLMHHLKVHALAPDPNQTIDYDEVLQNNQLLLKPKKKRGRRKKNPDPEESDPAENMTSARTSEWLPHRRAASPPAAPPTPPPVPPSPSPPPPPADPSRPFVCRHCGVGFAREKALQSHARVHGGDSPVECGACGELCWSREALAAHARHKHPHLPARALPARGRAPEPEPEPAPPYAHAPHDSDSDFDDTDSGDDDHDMDYTLSPVAERSARAGRGARLGARARTRARDERLAERAAGDACRGPELFCQWCGVAFQRADLLRRHVAAAHSYKRHDSTGSTWAEQEHACDVCGESCTDALQLLAHAELHAERVRHAPNRKRTRGRNNTSSSSGRQFPCRECGKVFGSRSSQQIHVRIHTGERPYACRFCWKAFADGGTLRKHERIHTGEKPYACAVCPRAFNQRVVLREHVRSHHSAPERRATDGYACVVCDHVLPSSAELVQHLIQHCDANTALKRQPQTGPRKYKRRRKLKSPPASPRDSWSPPPGPASSPPAPSPPPAASPAAAPPTPPGPATRRRRRLHEPPPPRPRMIHTEENKTKNKQLLKVRTRRPPRRPADDLRAIRRRAPSPPSPAARSPERWSPTPPSPEARSPERWSPAPPSPAARSPERWSPAPPSPASSAPPSPPSPRAPPSPTGPYRCEMCAQEFPRRDALLLHVPVHI